MLYALLACILLQNLKTHTHTHTHCFYLHLDHTCTFTITQLLYFLQTYLGYVSPLHARRISQPVSCLCHNRIEKCKIIWKPVKNANLEYVNKQVIWQYVTVFCYVCYGVWSHLISYRRYDDIFFRTTPCNTPPKWNNIQIDSRERITKNDKALIYTFI